MRDMTVEHFLSDPRLQNAWCKFEHMSVYLRKYYSSSLGARIDIANMDTPERYQGSGQFKRLVQLIAREVEPCKHPVTLVIENVLNEHLDAHLLEHGWTRKTGDTDFGSWPPSYTKLASECAGYASRFTRTAL